jgi:copper oxidase (laccase) domain-containing protein
VGGEVIEQLGSTVHDIADWYHPAQQAGKWYVDIYRLATQRLLAAGVTEVTGGGFCTFSESDRFYSYRRQPRCGRMASLIWLDPDAAA